MKHSKQSIKCIGGAHPRALSPRRWAMPSGMSPQSGRSMIEMLAVLAIMGILTVGGIAAYSFAVAKHRANQIYNQVDLRAVTAFSNPIVRQTQTGNTFFLPGFDDTFENMPYEHSKIGNAAFQIKVTDVPQKVCRRLQDMTFKLPRQVTLNGEDVSSACGAQNTFVFVYDGLSVGKPSSGVTPIDCDCSGCQSCETGTCQDNDNLCGPKEVCVSGRCQCASDYTECRGGCYTACGDGLMRDPISCDCVCEPQACPAFAQWDETTCSCQCEDGYDMCGGTCHPVCDGSGMTGSRDPETCACTCIEGTNAETCACPAGYIYINGQCQKFNCDGENGWCYINETLCGTYCTNTNDSQTVSCQNGICRPSACPSLLGEESFMMSTHQMAGHWQWGCKMPYGDCYWRDSQGFCFMNGQNSACAYTNLDQTKIVGSCDSNFCAAYGATFYPRDWWTSCLFDSGVFCAPIFDHETFTTWQCYSKNSIICSWDCSDPPSCGGACDGYKCNNGFTYDETKQKCCNADNICCSLEGSAYVCTREGTTCGKLCSTDATSCDLGTCYNPGCSDGWSFEYISYNNLWGCVKEDVACYQNSAKTGGIYCTYQNRNECGKDCTYDGVCQLPVLEICAETDSETGLKKCPFNKVVTETCTCPTNKTAAVGTMCCPAGHTATNNGCTLITCPDGQALDENGFCVDIE